MSLVNILVIPLIPEYFIKYADGSETIEEYACSGLTPKVQLCGSGHSFKLAPAIGQCLAELIAHGTPTTGDITPPRATRFEEGNQLRSTYGGNRG